VEYDHTIDRYFPLDTGYSWTYIEKEYSGGAQFTRKLVHKIIDKKKYGEVWIFNTNPNGLFAIYNNEGIAHAGALVVRDKNGAGITIKTHNDQPVYPSPLYYMLKGPLKKGTWWRNRTSIIDIIGQKFIITSDDASVELDNGLKFHNCIEVTSIYSSEGRKYKGKQWFAPGIGLVKSQQWRIVNNKEKLVYELSLMEPPNFLIPHPQAK